MDGFGLPDAAFVPLEVEVYPVLNFLWLDDVAEWHLWADWQWDDWLRDNWEDEGYCSGFEEDWD